MTVRVPTSMSTPEHRELNDEDTTLEMFSASLVMRLIRSPWEWLSR